MKQIIVKLLLLGAVFYPCTLNSAYVDLTIILEKGGNPSPEIEQLKVGEIPALTAFLIDGIEQEVPLLVSSSLMYALKEAASLKIDWDKLSLTPENKQKLQKLHRKMEAMLKAAIPSVRLPGSNSFFRAIAIDKNALILTMLGLKTYEMEYIQANKPVPPLEIKDVHAILLYPAFVSTPLKILTPAGGKIPTFISMIGSAAYHILAEIQVPHHSFDFALLLFRDPSEMPKTYFVRRLVCQDGVYENVTVQAHGATIKKVMVEQTVVAKVLSSSYFDPSSTGKYIYTPKPIELPEPDEFSPISNTEAISKIQEMMQSSLPSDEAVRQATGGQQTTQMLEETLAQYLKAP